MNANARTRGVRSGACLAPALITLTIGVALLPHTARAQSVVNPTTLQFTASPDHSKVTNGTPVVSGYVLSFYNVGGTTALASYNLGKPAPNASGVITVNLTTIVTTWPPSGVAYEARVTAVGPGGSSPSTPSNSFTTSGTTPTACTFSLGATSASIGSAASTGSVSVNAGAGCSWTAKSNTTAWLTVTKGASGSGPGSVSFSAAANTTTSSRSGTLTVAGRTFTVNQAAASCQFTVSPTVAAPPAAGTTGSTVGVTTTTGCAWTASESSSWLTISSGAAGTGSGTVRYSVAANSSVSSRTAAITVAGKAVTVTQPGVGCAYKLNPASLTLPSPAGSSTVTVTTSAGCSWSATESVNWLTLGSANGRTGSGSFTVTRTAYSGTSARTTNVTVAGKTLPVTQTSAPKPPKNPHFVAKGQ